ncbi:uncharacterized protein XM38_020980 [Halomicronema hongdechloris C2206]|uniref:DUF7734 domain-containing protein n=1 Tax=Halomicronema hongdechloris C2206 TaxID=1641165 RepID=A0A1Z3HLI2_9CYAN|nr:hypothetical protein [Halomicronema hongdechloris]ASC71148.1 uncharacterized protein XM38_020980 [Halomicronema hongdechloris C2206]
MVASPGKRLEDYTLKHPQEVLLVTADIDGATDEIVIFRGFSSSLVRPTAANPEVPVIPVDAKIRCIDRLQGPYTPDNPQYLERNLTWEAFQARLSASGI